MTPTRLVALLTVLAALAATWLTPEAALAPGDVGPGHRGAPCRGCHQTVSGVTVAACRTCHDAAHLSARVDAGSPLVAMHADFQACHGCHVEHGGAHHATFSHEVLTAAQRERCATCHAAPATPMHQTDAACATCHDTRSWKDAHVDHAKLAGRACETCHVAQRPGDALHEGAGACGSCHATGAWKPARFDHARFFPLEGDHAVACAQCHVEKGQFKKYDCTTCHEHSAARLAHEHDEEGIRGDLSDCVRCHRGGGEGEHEGKHGGEHRGEHGREHGEHDDE